MNDAQIWTIIIATVVIGLRFVWSSTRRRTELRFDSVDGSSIVLTDPIQEQIDGFMSMILAAARGIRIEDEDDDD